MPRVATYNVHDCVGRDGRYSPQRTAQVIQSLEADIVALQEITLDRAGDLVGYLQQATGMRVVDGTLLDRGVGRYGNVLLSRYAILERKLHDLSFVEREPRGVVDAILELGDASLRVMAVHLGLARAERAAQIQRLAALLDGPQRPTVLMGDFNVWLGARPLRPLQALGFRHARVNSFPTWRLPALPLDRILARHPAVIQRCWRHDSAMSRIASDHFPVVADIGSAA